MPIKILLNEGGSAHLVEFHFSRKKQPKSGFEIMISYRYDPLINGLLALYQTRKKISDMLKE